MNQGHPVFAGDFDHARPAPAYVRNDQRQRQIVDDGIQVQRIANTMTAFEFLRARGVDKCIIKRVLMEPERRRVPDADAFSLPARM